MIGGLAMSDLQLANHVYGSDYHYSFSTTVDPGYVDFAVTSVPEPGTLALLALD